MLCNKKQGKLDFENFFSFLAESVVIIQLKTNSVGK